eukprot:CAMPEP_0185348728 /NCGR_PEP_ID=MMETSP1364-20130426/1904_1 /TAXON_ID=38817 /ORGANISM="Gephyrocapsa oceanica, Strain RCC1303" /LENGTH=213 /DNA_ID=CAMNT_0027948183 /DNA_START=12 /DNA_END=649 /DNA_ORIENTATION=+
MATPPSITFETLPDELLLAVLSHLPPIGLCAVRVCDSRLVALATDSSLWETCHRRRWARPPLPQQPAAGWFADFARRSLQDARVLPLLRELREAARRDSPAARDRIWRELMAPGVELFDVACSLTSDGEEASLHEEAETLLRGLNQNSVRIEFEALLLRARQCEAGAEWLSAGLGEDRNIAELLEERGGPAAIGASARGSAHPSSSALSSIPR